jgi:hypothetical protein
MLPLAVWKIPSEALLPQERRFLPLFCLTPLRECASAAQFFFVLVGGGGRGGGRNQRVYVILGGIAPTAPSPLHFLVLADAPKYFSFECTTYSIEERSRGCPGKAEKAAVVFLGQVLLMTSAVKFFQFRHLGAY